MQNLDIISWLQNCTFVCEECKMRRGCNYFSFVSRHVCLLCHFHESALGTVFYTSVKATLLSKIASFHVFSQVSHMMDVGWIDMVGWISLAVVLGFNFIDVLRRTQPVHGCTSLSGAQVTVWVCWATSPFAPPAQTLTGPLSRSARTWVLRSQRPAWNPTKSKWKVQHPVEFSLLRLHSDVPFE